MDNNLNNDNNILESDEINIQESIDKFKIDENNEYSEDDKIMYEADFLKEEDKDKNNINNNKTIPEKKHKKKKKKSRHVASGLIIITLIISISVILALSIITFSSDVLGMKGSDVLRQVTIPEGASITQISKILKDEGIIDYPKIFIGFSKLGNSDVVFHSGTHEFKSSMSYKDIISELKNATLKDTIKVMFQEGITLYEAAQKLENNNICNADDFIWAFNNVDVTKFDFDNLVPSNVLKFYKMEGYFFPDTYNLCENSDPQYVAEVIKLNFNKKIYQKYYAEMQRQGLELDEVITLASIVQSEAPTKEDMEMVASVYWNRLNNSNSFPKLQSCPTRDYVEDIIQPNIDIGNDEIYAAYDTYQGEGLPVGAICNPGVDAIEAVLYPANTDYFFFCSNLDTKEFFYARTNAEHEKNLKLAGLK